jgi:lipid A oxidase
LAAIRVFQTNRVMPTSRSTMDRTLANPPTGPRAAHRGLQIALVAATASLLLPALAHAQLVLTLRQGKAWVNDADLRVVRPGGTDLTLRSVQWDDQSYRSPIYLGGTLTWWLPRHREWGLGVDFTHAKAILEADDVAFAEGSLHGQAVSGPIAIESVVPHLEFSHGLNLATLNVFRRWAGRPQPVTGYTDLYEPGLTFYLGFGAGVAVPHVEAEVDRIPTHEFQLAGPALRVELGLELPLDEHVAIAAEGIVSWTDVRADLAGGGRVETRLLVPQLTLGVALRD